MILSYKGATPRIDPGAIVLEPAVVVGDVEIGKDASIWFGAVVRGDSGPVRIGARSNVQDNCVIHVTTGGRTTIEEEVTVGHGAILHGCHLKRRCLIGMGATILDGAVVGENAMVGAGALVTGGMIIPDGHLAIGAPAKVRRPLTADEIRAQAESAAHYVEFSKGYL